MSVDSTGKRLSRLAGVTWHPFLLALSPVLALLAANPEQAVPGEALRPALLMLIGEAVLLTLVFAATRNIHRAAIIASGLTLLFVAYGHLYGVLETVTILGEPLGRHRYLIPVWGALALGVVLAGRRLTRPERWTGSLNVASVVLVLVPFISLAVFALTGATAGEAANPAEQAPASELKRPANPPDVYYIILDGYARADVLESMFAYDNTEFLQALAERGFFVAAQSQSNYAQTDLSIASSLNMAYLDELDERLGPETKARAPLRDFIQHSRLRSQLESVGYRTVAYDTGYKATELRDAAVFLNPRRMGLLGSMERGEVTPFESMLIYGTGLRALADSSKVIPEVLRPDVIDPFERHRQRVLFVLDSLAKMPEEPGTKFVFVHLVSPHQPFVFGPDGEAIDPEGPFTLTAESAEAREQEAAKGYVGQIEFLNGRILQVIDRLIADSAQPPVIVLQGDHGPPVGGPSATDRMSIFNAYFLPGDPASALYPSITPVNSFRLVLSEYFGADLPLLDDTAFYSSYNAPYEYQVVEPSTAG
jgi:hypothetical protein